MRRAIALARRGSRGTWPNPCVGALVVKDNKIIARGWHKRAGEAHAEVVALAEAGQRAQGATLYVSLEPCNHFGKTPPCVHSIISAGISKVVISCLDRNPGVSGGGASALSLAGIEVIQGCEQILGERLLGPWFDWVSSGRKRRIAVWGRFLNGDFVPLVSPSDRQRLGVVAERVLTRSVERQRDAEFVFPNEEALSSGKYLAGIDYAEIYFLSGFSQAKLVAPSPLPQQLELLGQRRCGQSVRAHYRVRNFP